MLRVLHGITTMHANVLTDIRLAADTGYDAVELLASKVVRFLDAGYRAEDLAVALSTSGLTATSINALRDVERDDEDGRRALFAETRRLCEVAAAIGCPVIQLVAFDALAGRAEDEILRLTASNVAAIADIGRTYGIAFQVEPIAWSPIRTLDQGLRLIDRVARPNVGLVVDFWHLWAAGDGPDAVARLDPSTVLDVHLCDGKRIPADGPWTEGQCRGYLPGEGDIPVAQWVDAVLATGYSGPWTAELFSPRHWEWEGTQLATECLARMSAILGQAHAQPAAGLGA